MAFGFYIHIPYCLQICPYCDFTKYKLGTALPPARYVDLLFEEIRRRSPDLPYREFDTLYFGGGTPSLLEPSLILAILKELEKAGFRARPDAEFTIEIDPATVDRERLETYLRLGINRFSVGAQTFNERLLKIAGRKHSSQDTVELLSLLRSSGVNYSFDLLFGLPSQTLAELKADIATALSFSPSHLSAYNLTVPESHPMSRGRAPDEEQAEMFRVIEDSLAEAGIYRYEISNFAKPGHESRHNLLYWTDQAYWGLGTGAHSYFPPGFTDGSMSEAPWGMRLWNPPSLNFYEKEIRSLESLTDPWRFKRDTPQSQLEILEKHQALTDFCHTSLRLVRGLDVNALRLKFGEKTSLRVNELLVQLEAQDLAKKTPIGWTMTDNGRLLANTVFEKLTFLPEDLK